MLGNLMRWRSALVGGESKGAAEGKTRHMMPWDLIASYIMNHCSFG